jgi:large subunit ribosomal protein L34
MTLLRHCILSGLVCSMRMRNSVSLVVHVRFSLDMALVCRISCAGISRITVPYLPILHSHSLFFRSSETPSVHLYTSLYRPFQWTSTLSSNGMVSLPTYQTVGTIQVRYVTYGREYQPSTLKRKRRFGFLARLRSRTGRKILAKRRRKGRKHLTH